MNPQSEKPDSPTAIGKLSKKRKINDEQPDLDDWLKELWDQESRNSKAEEPEIIEDAGDLNVQETKQSFGPKSPKFQRLLTYEDFNYNYNNDSEMDFEFEFNHELLDT